MKPQATTLTVFSLALAASTIPPASATNTVPAPPADAQEIPTQLDNAPTPEDLDGACSFCRVFPVTTNPGAPQEAFLELYFEDDGHSVLADIEVLVLLHTDEYRTLVIHDTQLVEQQTHEFTLGSDEDWDWIDVRHAWISVTPNP